MSASTDWIHDVGAGQVVALTKSDAHCGVYVSLVCRTTVSDDPAVAATLWSPLAKPYFTGPEDPDLRTLLVDVEAGEWWETASTGVGRIVSLVRAAVLGRTPEGSQGGVAGG